MDTRDRIVLKTFDLIMKYGIRSVSMDDISKAIGISKKTIYLHFDSKKKLISEVIANHLSEDERNIKKITAKSQNAIDEMVQIAKHILNFLRNMSPSMIFDTQKYYPLIWKQVEKEHFGFIRKTIKSNIERGQVEGFYHQDINSGILARIYVRQALALTDEKIFPLIEYSREELFRNIITYHMRGIMSEKGLKKFQKLSID